MSFTVGRRDRLSLAGPNGAGKTTLLRAIAGETSLQGGKLAFAKGTRMALHDQRPPLEFDLTLREYALSGARDLLEAEAELRSLDSDLSRVVLDLRVSGALSLAGRRQFEERILQGAGSALRALRFDETKLLLEPTDQDLDEIDHAGFVRVAADRLRIMVGDTSDPARARLAALALKRLYLEQMREA